MSREKSEKVCITFRLSEEEHEKLKQYSSACGLSTAEFMRQLCRGNAPQPQPEKEFWELLGTLYEVHVAFKKSCQLWLRQFSVFSFISNNGSKIFLYHHTPPYAGIYSLYIL